MTTLTEEKILEVNQMLAKDFIESRLDVEVSLFNIQFLATAITLLERTEQIRLSLESHLSTK